MRSGPGLSPFRGSRRISSEDLGNDEVASIPSNSWHVGLRGIRTGRETPNEARLQNYFKILNFRLQLMETVAQRVADV